jgi:hypothetical protein
MPPAVACGFDGLMEGNWTPLHPRSIDVAAAVREQADKGLLDASLLDARSAGPMGMLRATKQLRGLGLRFTQGAVSASTAPSMAVLLVESGLWTRYTRTAEGITPQVHVAGPDPVDAVIVTSEAVITAVLAGRLTARQAFDRGLVVVDGPAKAAREAEALFN